VQGKAFPQLSGEPREVIIRFGEEPLSRNSTILALSTLSHVLVDSFTVAIAIILAEIFGRSGRYFSVGIILAFFTLATAIAEPAWGRLSDSIGRRGAIVSIGLVLSGFFFFSFSLIDPAGPHAVALFSAASFFTGLAAGTYHSVATTLLNESAGPSERGLYQGINNAGGSVGRTAAPLAIAYLISRFTLGAVFVPYLVFGTVVGFVSLALYPRTSAAAKPREERPPLSGSLKRFTASLMLFSFLRTAFFMTAMNFLPSYLMGFKGLGAIPTGYMMTFILATGIIAQPIGGRLSDMRDRAKLMALLLVFSGAAFGTAIFLPVPLSIVLVAASFFALLMTFPILFALIGDFVPKERMGMLTGLVSGAGGVSSTALQFAAGYTAENFSPPLVLLSLSVFPVMAAGVAFKLNAGGASKVGFS